jgi:hypothetical protein
MSKNEAGSYRPLRRISTDKRARVARTDEQ